jgi:hypothetical protein
MVKGPAARLAARPASGRAAWSFSTIMLAALSAGGMLAVW